MKWLVLLLFALPLKAQDSASVVIGADSIYWFQVDTLHAKKVDAKKPWISGYRPPPIYGLWIYEIARCERLKVPKGFIKSIRWNYINMLGFGGKPPYYSFLGYTLPTDPPRIYIVLPLIHERWIIQHEVLHALLIANGYPIGHPKPFYDRCDMEGTG